MARRRNTMAGLSVSELDAVMRHPEQLSNLEVINGLLRKFDDAGNDPARLRDLQESLYRATYRAQEFGHDIRRVLERLGSGKTTGWPKSHDAATDSFIAPSWRLQCAPDCRDALPWDVEQGVAERIDRQLKSVGDGLAWRVYGYDRRAIIALAQNDPSGPFTGKDGLVAERRMLAGLWSEHGHFALMHDLTSVLRIVDITEVQASGSRLLREVKTNPKASARKQLRLAQAALDAIAGETPLPSRDPACQTYLWRSSVQLRTHIRQLRQLIDQASRYGSHTAKIGDRVAGAVNLLTAAQAGEDFGDQWETYDTTRQAALHKHLPQSVHRMKSISADAAGRDPAIAPFAIFPLPAWQRAGLICDYVIIETTIAAHSLIAALGKHGMSARPLLPSANGARSPGEEVLEVIKGQRRMVLRGAAVTQMLHEWVLTERYARATAGLIGTTDVAPQGVLTFSNERAQWT
jgi:hypothetical protein